MALVNRKETRNFNAVSALVDGDAGTPIMYMNASYNGVDLNFSKNIQNVTLYEQNKEMVDSDYLKFENEIIKSITG